MDRESGRNESAEEKKVENDEDGLQDTPEEKRRIKSQRRESGEQDGDERGIDKTFERQFGLEYRLSHGIVKGCEVAERLRACINGGSEIVSVAPGEGIVGEEEESNQGGDKDEFRVLSCH